MVLNLNTSKKRTYKWSLGLQFGFKPPKFIILVENFNSSLIESKEKNLI